MSFYCSLGVVIFLFVLRTGASSYSWTTIPPDLTKVQGQSMSLTWIIDLSDTTYFTTEVRQWKGSNKLDIIFKKHDTQPTVEGPFQSRSSDLSFTVTQSGNVMSATFNLSNLVKSTDEAEYDLIVTTQKGDTTTVTRKTRLTINVPPTIASQHPITISSIESQTVQLVCNATGFPTPSINWTRNGVVVGTGSPFNITAKAEDHNQCYTCVAYNGVYGAKSANVCLAIQYKPVSPHQVTSDRSTVCQNDNVTLTCTSGPANPEATNYKFYYNHVLVHNSSSNVYVTQATHGHPNVNRFTCVPSNLVGDSLQNGTVDVMAKVAPAITQTTDNPVVVEGTNLTLTCNVSGTPPFNVTWTKPGKPNVHGMVNSITNINRHDEGVYRCTVNNGGECPAHSATINVTVNYEPTIRNFSKETQNIDENDDFTLTCKADGNPVPQTKWTKEGDNQTFNVGQSIQLSATPKTAGKYRCSVTNGVGKMQVKDFTIVVKGYCDQHQCKPGSTCVSTKKSYRCQCTRGLKGDYCQDEDPTSKQFLLTLTFVQPSWKPEFSDKNSKDFKDIEKKICAEMKRIFGPILIACSLRSLRKGSVITETQLTFNESKLQSEVEKGIKDGSVNGTKLSAELVLKDSSFIQATPSATPCSSDPCKFDGVCKEDGNGYKCECKLFRHGQTCEKGIGVIPGVIIIVGALLLIIIVIILLCLYCGRVKSSSNGDLDDNRAKTMDEIRYIPNENHPKATENFSFEDEYLKRGRYDNVPRDNDVKSTRVSFQPESTTPEDEEPTKTMSQGTIYTDVISAMMNTSDENEKHTGNYTTLEEDQAPSPEPESKNQPEIELKSYDIELEPKEGEIQHYYPSLDMHGESSTRM